jgi:hypothetical protein
MLDGSVSVYTAGTVLVLPGRSGNRPSHICSLSQITVDKVLTLPREKIGKRVGIWGNTL